MDVHLNSIAFQSMSNLQKQQFLGEAVRWIKCNFIDCDAQEQYEKEYRLKMEVR